MSVRAHGFYWTRYAVGSGKSIAYWDGLAWWEPVALHLTKTVTGIGLDSAFLIKISSPLTQTKNKGRFRYG